MSNFYHTSIELENYDQIQQELKKIVDVHFFKGIAPLRSDYKPVNYLQPIVKKSQIGRWFDQKRLVLKTIAVVVTEPNTDMPIHYDVIDKSQYNALNIEIENCSLNSVKMYKPKYIGKFKIKSTEDNNLYFQYKKEDCELVTSYNLEKPTIVNVAQLHQVCNNTDKFRVAISFRFYNEILKEI